MEGVISGVDGRRNTIEGRRFGCYERNVTVSTQWQRWWGAAARPGVDFGRGEIGAIVFLGGASSDEEKDVLERSAFCCSLCCSYSCCWSWSCNMRIVYMEIVKIYNICVLCLKHREVKLASKTSRDDASVLNPWKKITEDRVHGNHLDCLILLFNGLLLLCNGLLQLQNGLTLSGNPPLLFSKSFFLLFKHSKHFPSETYQTARGGPLEAWPRWLHTFSLLKIGFGFNTTFLLVTEAKKCSQLSLYE